MQIEDSKRSVGFKDLADDYKESIQELRQKLKI